MLVFSSAEMTYSSLPKGRSCQQPWYKSRTRPALDSNWGSRGKIQLRCCQGRMASSSSQRQMVLPLICATRPRALTSRTKSWRLNRESGKPVARGNAQASALTRTTTAGGKNGRAPGPGFILQTGQPFLEEAFAPFADYLARDRKTGGNLVMGLALSGQEDHFGADYRII